MVALFHTQSIHAVIQARTEQVKVGVQKLDANYLLNVSEEDLVRSLVDDQRLNVPIIRDDGIDMDIGETQIDVSQNPNLRFEYALDDDDTGPVYVHGTKTVIFVPFEGDAGFFEIQPTTFSSSPPRGEVRDKEIVLTYEGRGHDAGAVKRECMANLQSIKEYLRSLSESAQQFNDHLEGLVRKNISERKQRLLAQAGMAKSIGLPLRKRENAPTTYAVPVKRRKPRLERPKVTSGSFAPEPALATEEYDEILSIISNMARVMEYSPSAFHNIDEEHLRFHFLVHLNGQYEGQATGETFNFQGKTDILIRVDGKNAFVAECKFWKGEKQLHETIDQLLGYLSWRDTKTAILFFNRNRNFSRVLEKVGAAVPTHTCFKRDLGKADESTFRYVFHQPNDPNREVQLAVMVFDIPVPPNTTT